MPDEVETMMYEEREIPWHRRGTPVQGLQDSRATLLASGGDYEVRKVPVYAKTDELLVAHWENVEGLEPDRVADPEPVEIEIPNLYAVVRDRDRSVLSTVGERYQERQNWQGLELMDIVVDSSDAMYDTAGVLSNGKVFFAVAQFPDNLWVGGEGGDPIARYLALAMSHDRSLALQLFKTNVRIVCRNTLNLAIAGAVDRWVLRHEGDMDAKVTQIREALELSFRYDEAFEQQMNELLAIEMGRREFEQFTEKLTPGGERRQRNTRMAMLGNLESSQTIDDGWRYTRYGALQAVAEYMDWIHPIRGSSDRDEDEMRTELVWFGRNREVKNKALELLSA